MRFEVVTLFPEMVTTVAEFGVVGRAQRKGLMELGCENPRDHTHDVHRTVDDRPYGGGPGMVMKFEPLAGAIAAVRERLPQGSPVVYLSPQGRRFDHQRAVALFLSLGYHNALINRLERAYKMRWEEMRRSLDLYLPNSTRTPTFGGSSYWVAGPEALDSDTLAEAALQAGIIIEPGQIFFATTDGPKNFFRLGFSSIDSSMIEPGIARLAELISDQVQGA